MTSLEVHANIRARTIHPADASNLGSGDTIRMKMSFGPRHAIVNHLEHHIRGVEEDPNSESVRASHITSTSYGGSGLDLWELGGSVIPAVFAVVALFYDTVLHVLEVDTINTFSIL